MNNNPADTRETLTQYRKMMHPDAKKAAKDSYLKVLQSSCLPAHTDLDKLGDQLTNVSSWNDGSDDYSVSICNIMAHHHNPLAQILEIQENSGTSKHLSTHIQPVRFPDERMMRMLRSPMDNIVSQVLPHAEADRQPEQPLLVCHQIGQCARVDTRRDLTDTGASVSATGRLEILHHFTPHTPYEIMGYDGMVTRAAGQGTAYDVRCKDKEEMEEMFFVYILSIDGTIISNKNKLIRGLAPCTGR